MTELFSDLPEWIDAEAWDGFVEMRKKIKEPLTERAKKIALRKLDEFRKAGHDPNDILDNATLGNWTGLYAPDKPAKSKQMDTASAWMEFRACIRDNRLPADPALQSIIRSFGGLNRLGELSSWDIENRIRKDFDAGYRMAKAH